MKPDISEKEKKVYVTLYKKDAPSYAMILLATLLEFVYVVSILDVMPVTFMMGVAVIVNIFLLFLLFTCAVKVNVYEMRWRAKPIPCTRATATMWPPMSSTELPLWRMP